MDRMLARLREDSAEADRLHERSRRLLVAAARAGAEAGLSQREIAAAIGRSQPEVSRLLRFQASSARGRRLVAERRRIHEVLRRYGMKNPRVFGSVARGEDGPDSDFDLLVTVPSGTSLFDLARLEIELTELLGGPVDVTPDRSLRPEVSVSAERDAIPL